MHRTKRHRKISTSRTDCPSEAALLQNLYDGSSTLTVEDGGHLHDATEFTAAYPAVRTLGTKVDSSHLAEAGVSPKATFSTLRQINSMCKTNLRDIYNLKEKERNASLAGRPPLEVFLHKLAEKQIRKI